jgi:cysteine synthase
MTARSPVDIPVVPGPTYAEMRDPSLLTAARREAARQSQADELAAGNLFNISWRRDDGSVSAVALPPSLTGVDATIIVLVGAVFPSGSHKVGPAYAMLAEAEALDGVRPGTKTIVGPSTGNFGIGTAYVSRLKGYQALVVMPDTMSRERYERIQRYGAKLDLTPGSESDVILTLERTRDTYVRDPRYLVLAQFEFLPNYRFHYCVTGDAALRVASGHGNGRVAAFVAAPGSAGTLAAGDAIKARFSECAVVALEPRECPTLYSGGQGQHRIEGIGDKMVTLIHNVATTDYVALVHDDDCVRGLAVVHDASAALASRLGLDDLALSGRYGEALDLKACLGVSGICNIIGAIKTAKLLGLGRNDNVVTVATDRFDRYPSVLADLAERAGPLTDDRLAAWSERIFAGADTSEIRDVRGPGEKNRLQAMKAAMWSRFGYTDTFLDAMKSQNFWQEQVGQIPAIDQQIAALR